MAEARTGDAERRLEQQQAACLRLVRLLAEEGDPGKLLIGVVAEAVALVGGNRGHMRRWNPERQALVAVAAAPPQRLVYDEIALGERLSRRAALSTTPLLVQDYVSMRRTAPESHGPTETAIVVALRLETRLLGTRLLGTLFVASDDPAVHFTEEDAQTIAVLGSLATAVLMGQERARLRGALLAARTVAHELNNQLALTAGYSEMVASQPELSPTTQWMAGEALRGAREAAATVARLQQVTRPLRLVDPTAILRSEEHTRTGGTGPCKVPPPREDAHAPRDQACLATSSGFGGAASDRRLFARPPGPGPGRPWPEQRTVVRGE